MLYEFFTDEQALLAGTSNLISKTETEITKIDNTL